MIFQTFHTPSFMDQAQVCLESIKLFHPEVCTLASLQPDTNGGYIPDLPKLRFEEILRILYNGTDEVVQIGADCVLYNQLTPFLSTPGDIVLTPHVIKPPMTRGGQLYATGHANADLILFRKGSIPILEWLIKQDMTDKQSQGIFYEQTWLSALPFIFNNVGICRHPGINFAWYNLNERTLRSREGSLFVDNRLLRMVQFSGFIKGQPDKISKHYNEVCTDPLVLELFRDYNNKIS